MRNNVADPAHEEGVSRRRRRSRLGSSDRIYLKLSAFSEFNDRLYKVKQNDGQGSELETTALERKTKNQQKIRAKNG